MIVDGTAWVGPLPGGTIVGPVCCMAGLPAGRLLAGPTRIMGKREDHRSYERGYVQIAKKWDLLTSLWLVKVCSPAIHKAIYIYI